MHETHVQMTNKREWWLLLYSLVHHTTIPLSTYTRYEYINIYYVYIFIWFIFIIINKRLSVILEYNNTSTRCHECTCLLSHTITCIKQELGNFLTAGYKCDTCKYDVLAASMLQWMVIWCLAFFFLFLHCHGSNVQHYSGHVSTLYISVSGGLLHVDHGETQSNAVGHPKLLCIDVKKKRIIRAPIEHWC